jgi:hypothetical protein
MKKKKIIILLSNNFTRSFEKGQHTINNNKESQENKET